MATVLGVGDNAGSDTLTVTLTVAQPAGSVVHAIHAGLLHGLPFFSSPSVVGLPTDTQAGTWSDSAGNPPILGAIQNGNTGAPSGSRAGLQLGQTAMRTGGTSLGVGDSVTVTRDDHGFGAAQMTLACFVVAFASTEYSSTVVTQYLGGTAPGNFVGVEYSNGLINDDMSPFNGNTLNWNAAFSGTLSPYPHDAAVMLSAAATFPAATANSYVPAAGSLVAQHNSADGLMSLAFALAPAPALTVIEPGGSFGGSVSIMVGTYQFATGSIAPPTSKCKKCGGMLGGVSVSSSFSKWL